MNLSSAEFLILFMPIFIFVYYLPIRKNIYKEIILFLANICFCCWATKAYIFLVITMVVLVYLGSLIIDRIRNPRNRKRIFIIIVAVLVGSLLGFKYFNQLIELLNLSSLNNDGVFLPIGYSFLIFTLLSYLIDVYRKECNSEKNLLQFLNYTLLFPKFLQGPILTYDEYKDKYDNSFLFSDTFNKGIERIVIGLSKKILLGDTLGYYVNILFNTEGLGSISAWVGAIIYTLEIYFDFSGYSDMAIGIGWALGFKMKENFNSPYLADSVCDFWKKWHISLTDWFRKYVYFPLGGNRCTKRRWVINSLIVWILTGMWHGSSFVFILWGLWHAFFQLLEKKTGFTNKLSRSVRHIYTISVVSIGWIGFRAGSLKKLVQYSQSLIGMKGAFDNGTINLLESVVVLIFISISFILLSNFRFDKFVLKKYVVALRVFKYCFLLLCLVVDIIICMGGSTSEFIYQKF